ncbi:MAG: leucine-rich repeat protein [Clostridia bacterium]|nr:leucine-rich repeat protein [Clostridia bacterium]
MKRWISMLLAFVMVFTSTFGFAENSLRLPANLKVIADEAFRGSSSLTVADVPYGTESIEDLAFADSALERIYIPGTVSSIAGNAFSGTSAVIASPASSYAHTYAEELGLSWEDCGNHYGTEIFNAALDILGSGETIENPTISSEETLSTDGITDPEMLAQIEEYNALVLEMQALIDEYNDTSSLSEALAPLEALYADLSFSESGGSVAFSLGSSQLVMDSSLQQHFQSGGSITDSVLSEDGNSVSLFAGSTEYVLHQAGDTLYLSAADAARAYPAVYSRSASSSDSRLTKLRNAAETISQFRSAFSIWIEMQRDATEEIVTSNQRCLEKSKKLNIDELTEAYTKRATRLEDKLNNLTRLSGMISALSIPGQISRLNKLFDSWADILLIRAHQHPTENDLSQAARKTADKLNDEISRLAYLYYIDGLSSIAGLITSVAAIASAVATFVPLPPPLTATLAALTAGSAAVAATSFVLGLGLSALENNLYLSVFDLDSTLHTTVSGTVYDADTRMPLQYVSVFSPTSEALTDANGHYEIYLQPGTYPLYYRLDGYQTQEISVTLESGDTLQKDIELSLPKVTLTGVVRDADTYETLPNVTIVCGYEMTLSNYDGSYSIELPVGPQTLSFYLDGYWDLTISLVLEEGRDAYKNVWMDMDRPTPTPRPTATPTPMPTPDKNATPADCFDYRYGSSGLIITDYFGDYTDVVIPSYIEDGPGYVYPVTGIDDCVFWSNKTITSIIIPDTVTYIGEEAFAYCSALTSVFIPGSVTTLAAGAFHQCAALRNITIPDSVTSIGDSAFYGCESLTSISIPDSVTSLGNYAFSECSSLRTATLPDTFTIIPAGLFYGCESLTSFTIPKRVTWICSEAFQGCNSLTSITIPHGVTDIGSYAFGWCMNLTSISIPNSVTYIGEFAFTYTRSLKSVTIPSSVTHLGQAAFLCSKLTSVVIPSSITHIREATFELCGMKSVVIPYGVTRIERDAFTGNYLEKVHIPSSVTYLDDEAFDDEVEFY